MSAVELAPHEGSAPVIRTVLVEDSDDVRYLMGTLLELDGRFEVVAEAADPRGALQVIADLDPDLVLVDLHLDRADGAALIRALRQTRTTASIVVVTGSPHHADHDGALAAGADAVFGKEEVIGSLAGSLADLVTRRRTARSTDQP